MADKYLMKVGLDFDQAQLDKVTGAISDQLVEMGKVSDEFIDNALATAKKYNEELTKQQKIVAEIDARLKKGGLDPATKQLLEQTKKKSEDIIKDYTYGNKEKGLESKAVVDAVADYAGSMKSTGSKLKEAGSNAVAGIGKFAAGVNIAITAVKAFADQIGEAIDKIANYSNQLNPLGAFGSQSQRDIMTRYGLSGTQALGFQNSLDALGMSESDIGRMTAEQRRVFNSLNEFWNEGIGKLDPDKLDRFTQSMSEYQEMQAKFQMGLQLTILKLVSESKTFDKFIGKIGDFFDVTLDFLGSPLVQAVFDGLIDFLTTVVTILEKAMSLISKIPGFGSANPTNITNNNGNTSNNSTYNIYGNDFHNNDELARQLSYSNKGGYNG